MPRHKNYSISSYWVKLTLLLCLVFSNRHHIFAQSSSLGLQGKLSGSIKDSADLSPVEFASVGLIDQATGKIIDGTMSDDKGNFVFENVSSGTYKVSVMLVGYQNNSIENITVSEENKTTNIGVISLSRTKNLEVVIEGKKTLIVEEVDRVIYNAENDATNKGGDATDVLRKAPMLSVDLDGNLSLRGNQNVKVLINGKASTMTAGSISDALKQIPADQIKSVEVITSPSAKYDAEGSAGVINIIMKKNTLQGFALNVDASAGVRASNLGINGSYRKKKMGFSLGGFGRAGYNIPGSFQNNQAATDPITRLNTQTIQQANTQNTMGFANYKAGWDYDIDSSNSITTSAKFSLRDMNNTQIGLFTQTYTNDSLTGTNTRDTKMNNGSHSIDANLTYTHLFKKPKQEFSFSTLYSRSSLNNNFTNSIYNNADLSTIATRLKNQNIGYNQEFTLQADYQQPVSKSQFLEIGAKNISRSASSNYQYYSAIGPDGGFVPYGNNNLNNTFHYNQNISAGYTVYTLNFLKSYTVKAGVRYEYTSINANFENKQSNPISIPSYSVLVPSFNVSKKLKNGNMIKASYTRRIQRPSLQFLNPNIQASNPYNITIGNPNLKPEYANNYELSYSQYIGKSSITLASFIRNTTGAIQSVRSVSGDTLKTTYQNIGNEDAYGFNLFANISISDRFTLNGGPDVYYAVLKNNNSNPIFNASNQGWVISGRITASYNLTKDWALQVFGFYRGNQVQLQGYQTGFGLYSLSLKKDFKNKKASLGFGAENFFTPSLRMRTELISPTLNQSSANVMHRMNFKINFSYKFGKLSSNAPKNRKKSIENDDLKTGNDNSAIDSK